MKNLLYITLTLILSFNSFILNSQFQQDRNAKKITENGYRFFMLLQNGKTYESKTKKRIKYKPQGKNNTPVISINGEQSEIIIIPNTKSYVGFTKYSPRKLKNKSYLYVSKNAEFIAEYQLGSEDLKVKILSVFKKKEPNFSKIDKEITTHINNIQSYFKKKGATDLIARKKVKNTFGIVDKEEANKIAKRRIAAKAAAKRAEEATIVKEEKPITSQKNLPKRKSVGVTTIDINSSGKQSFDLFISGKNRAMITGATFWGKNYFLSGRYYSNTKKTYSAAIKLSALNKPNVPLKGLYPDFKGGITACDGTDQDYLVGTYGTATKYTGTGGNTYKTIEIPNLVAIDVLILKNNRSAILACDDDGYKAINMKSPYNHDGKNLTLIIWDHATNKRVKIPIVKGRAVSTQAKMIQTQDGNIVIGYDLTSFQYVGNKKILNSSYIYWKNSSTNLIKVAVNKSYEKKSLYKYWKKSFNNVNSGILSDMVQDKYGDIIFLCKSMPAYHNGKGGSRGASSTLFALKVNRLGEYITGKKFNKLGQHLFRGESRYKPKFTNEIYMGALDYPKLLENPNNDGYIVTHRAAYDQLQSKRTGIDSDFNGKNSQDIPLLIHLNGQTLLPESADFLPVYSLSSGHRKAMNGGYVNYPERGASHALTPHFAIRNFSYDKTTKRFIVVEQVISYQPHQLKGVGNEKNQYSKTNFIGNLHVWSLKVNLKSGQEQAKAIKYDPILASNKSKSSSNNSSSSSSSNSSTSSEAKFSGSITFHHDRSGNNNNKTLYIHYGGSNTSDVRKTTLGNTLSIPCRNEKVYYSLTGKKSDMTLIKQTSTEDCDTKIRSSSFL